MIKMDRPSFPQNISQKMYLVIARNVLLVRATCLCWTLILYMDSAGGLVTSGDFIHMNAAGACPPSPRGHAAVVAHLDDELRVGGYAAAAKALGGSKSRLYPHEALALLVCAEARNMAVVESAQRGWSLAFSSITLSPAVTVFCWQSEYAGNAVQMLRACKASGAALEVLPVLECGVVDVDALKLKLSELPDPAAAVICLTHINTDSSVIQPAEAVSSAVRAAGALFLLDSCQSFGLLPLDLPKLGCDFAVGTGRKWLRGPRGTGVLFCSDRALKRTHPLLGEPAVLDHSAARWTGAGEYELAEDAGRFEMWESSVALARGLGVAAEDAAAIGLETVFKKATGMAETLREELEVYTSRMEIVMRDAPRGFEAERRFLGAGVGPIVCFEAESSLNIAAETFVAKLFEAGIGASVSPSGHTFNDGQWSRPKCVRLSPTYFNTEQEVEKVAREIGRILEEAKKI